MKPHAALLGCLLGALAQPGQAQVSRSVTVGSKVRVYAPAKLPGPMAMRVLAVSGDSLVAETLPQRTAEDSRMGAPIAGPTRHTLGMAEIERLHVATGSQRNWKNGLAAGGLLGFFAAGIASADWVEFRSCDGGVCAEWEPAERFFTKRTGRMILVPALVGGAIGLAIRTDTWKLVDCDDKATLTLSPAAGPGQGGVALRFRF